jgi:hypothetical protein
LKILIGAILTAIAISVCSFFYFSPPSPFLTEKELVEKMNRAVPQMEVKNILDSIPLDPKHLFVPYISKSGAYGVSHWVWRWNEWKLASMDSTGEPKTWKLKENDPSTHYIVWNIAPSEQVDYVEFYLIRNRNYIVSDGEEQYVPKVELMKEMSFSQHPYGVMNLPLEWVQFMQSYKETVASKQTVSLFDHFYFDQHIYFGWLPYNGAGEYTFPESSVNGMAHYFEDITLDHLMILNEIDLETK